MFSFDFFSKMFGISSFSLQQTAINRKIEFPKVRFRGSHHKYARGQWNGPNMFKKINSNVTQLWMNTYFRAFSVISQFSNEINFYFWHSLDRYQLRYSFIPLFIKSTRARQIYITSLMLHTFLFLSKKIEIS